MPATPFDSAMYSGLFGDAEIARLFSDNAEIRAMLLVEGALAQAQGKAGMIPEISAAAIHRAAHEVQIDPAALAGATGTNGVPVPALVTEFRKAMAAPEHAQYVHWGATSQDIMDTALALRLRRVLEIAEARLDRLLNALAALADAHADLPMIARSYGQAATPTSFGAVVASWGWPLLRHRERLDALRPRLLRVSLGGASGTLSAMGGNGPAVRAAMAEALDLGDPGANWHTARDGIGELAGWATALTASLGKMGEDLILLSQTGIGEVRLGGAGGSSTMPNKQNPVAPSVLVALARMTVALNGAVQGAALHRQSRDGAAWFTEWLALAQICTATGRALSAAGDLAATLAPVPERMASALGGDGLIHAEALSFALARHMPRPEAQAAVGALCDAVRAGEGTLPELAAARWPELDLGAELTPAAQLGEAPREARRFAGAARWDARRKFPVIPRAHGASARAADKGGIPVERAPRRHFAGAALW